MIDESSLNAEGGVASVPELEEWLRRWACTFVDDHPDGGDITIQHQVSASILTVAADLLVQGIWKDHLETYRRFNTGEVHG